MPEASPQLAVVVMSYRNEATIEAAVRSILEQDTPAELVVSHSGGGPTAALLAERFPQVRVVDSKERLFPGGTRNAGVEATSAPFVAFLAADCVALPGWVRGRLAHHGADAQAVASALVPLTRDAASLGANLMQHSNRLPGYQPAPALRFGVSYARDALTRFGPFPPGEGHPEDVAVNERILDAGLEIAWAPEVLTAHTYLTSIRAMVRDQHRRGRIHGALHGPLPWRMLLAARVPAEAVVALRRARSGPDPLPRGELPRAIGALLLAALATGSGKVRGGGPVDAAAQRFAAGRRARHFAALRRRLQPWR